jgi:hypothetical protein
MASAAAWGLEETAEVEEIALRLEELPFPSAKSSQSLPSISLKTKGNFGRKERFQNLWVKSHS